MVRKEGQEAIDYLARIQETIPPEITILNLPWLSKMLELESLHISRLMQSGLPELAGVTIDATGFPELEPWKADLAKICQEFNNLREKRKLALLPFRNMLVNASPQGITEEGSKLAVKLAEDLPLISALSNTGNDFREALNPSSNTLVLPFFKYHDYPGLLFTKISESQFSLLNADLLAFKFISSFKNSPVFFCIGMYQNDDKIRSFFHPNPDMQSSKLCRSSQSPFEKEVESSFKKPVQKALLDFDPTLVNEAQVQKYLDALSDLNKLIIQSKSFMDAIVDCKQGGSEEINKSVLDIAGKTSAIFQSVENDDLRKRLQIVVGECMEEFFGKPQQIKEQKETAIELRPARPIDKKEDLKQKAKYRLREILEEVKQEPFSGKIPDSVLDKALENYDFIEKLVNEQVIKEYFLFTGKFIGLAGGGLKHWRIDLGSSKTHFEGSGFFEENREGFINSFLTLARADNYPLVLNKDFIRNWWEQEQAYERVHTLANFTKEQIIKKILNNL